MRSQYEKAFEKVLNSRKYFYTDKRVLTNFSVKEVFTKDKQVFVRSDVEVLNFVRVIGIGSVKEFLQALDEEQRNKIFQDMENENAKIYKYTTLSRSWIHYVIFAILWFLSISLVKIKPRIFRMKPGLYCVGKKKQTLVLDTKTIENGDMDDNLDNVIDLFDIL